MATKLSIEQLCDAFGFDPNERELVDRANHATTIGGDAVARTISELILSKAIRKAADSNEKYSRRMVYLTWALVGVGVLQAWIGFRQTRPRQAQVPMHASAPSASSTHHQVQTGTPPATSATPPAGNTNAPKSLSKEKRS